MKNKFLFILLLVLFLLYGCGSRINISNVPANTGFSAYNTNNRSSENYRQPIPQETPLIVLKNTFLRFDTELGLQIDDLFGDLISQNPSQPVNFDNVNSFYVNIHQAKMVIDTNTMNILMNKHIFNFANSPISNLNHRISQGNILTISGNMKTGFIQVPFEMTGPINATPDGLIKFTPNNISAMGVPSKKIMDVFGLKTDAILNLNNERGIGVEGNSIIMYPDRLFPPPKIRGRVTRVETIPNAMMVYFDSNNKPRRPPLPVQANSIRNYGHVYGGRVRLVSNVTYQTTNVLLVDKNQKNPFEFFMAQYTAHTKVGEVHLLDDQGAMITVVPDFRDISAMLSRGPGWMQSIQGMNYQR